MYLLPHHPKVIQKSPNSIEIDTESFVLEFAFLRKPAE